MNLHARGSPIAISAAAKATTMVVSIIVKPARFWRMPGTNIGQRSARERNQASASIAVRSHFDYLTEQGALVSGYIKHGRLMKIGIEYCTL